MVHTHTHGPIAATWLRSKVSELSVYLFFFVVVGPKTKKNSNANLLCNFCLKHRHIRRLSYCVEIGQQYAIHIQLLLLTLALIFFVLHFFFVVIQRSPASRTLKCVSLSPTEMQ